MKPFFVPAARLMLPTLSACALVLGGCSKAAPEAEVIRPVRTMVLKDMGGTLAREFAGEVKARVESRLGFQVGGKVVQREVVLGQTVKAGQSLARLDGQDLQLSQESARAQVAAAEANAVQAAANLQRFTELKGQGFISQAELDRYVTAARTAEASLRQAKAQLGVQGNQARYATLVAPASGVITAVDVEPGQVVSPGAPVLTLAQDGPRDVVFAVPEDFVGALRKLQGQTDGIQVRRWGATDWAPGSVREVAASADPVSRTYLVKADVRDTATLALGQTAAVRLVMPVAQQGGIRIPLTALAERQGQSVVWLLDTKAMTVAPTPVSTGDVTDNSVIVTKGLASGQEVITAGAHVLTPGQKVKRYQEAIQPAASAASSN